VVTRVKHDDDRMNMWFSMMISILLHTAVILLVPITVTHHVTVYPVEFGEISQTFASTRQGSSVGTTLPAPAKIRDTTLEDRIAETKQEEPLPEPQAKEAEPPSKKTQEIVKEATKPAEPDKLKTEDESKEKPATQPELETVAAKPDPLTVKAIPEPKPDDLGKVLTGSSDESIQIPESKADSSESGDGGLPTFKSPVSPEPSSRTQGSGDTEGRSYAEDETGEDEETATKGNSQEAEETGPEKPKGHEFGRGESLAINSVPPRYPKGAQNVDLVGNVRLEVTVDRDGKILSVDVSQASGYGDLDEQARMTVLSLWRFKGIGWPYRIQVTVAFKGEADVDVQFGGVTVLEN
jgi:TonB family protein